MTRPTHLVSAALGLALLGCSQQEGGGRTRPNLLLVSIDCLRADHVSCYGYGRETTPTLDRLATGGVRFERTISSSSWTLPAHLSMLTGLPVSAHGVDDDRLYSRRDAQGVPIEVPLRGVFVSEVLQSAGYATAGFFTWKYLENPFGFGPGFDVWERLGHTFYSHPEVGPRWERLQTAGDVQGMKALAAEHADLFDAARPSAPETVDRALEWLGEHEDAQDEQPFFLFVHLFDVHDPYHPPEPHYSLFGEGYQGPIDGHNVTSPDSPVRGDMHPADLKRLVSLYDGAIHFVDAELARLFEGLRARGLEENTLVMVTADHGEEFFEHGHKTHRRQLFMESIAVPLILSWPAGLPAGRVVRETTGLVDLVPTLLSAAGVEGPVPTAGRDLLPLARGESGDAARSYLAELTLFDGGGAPQRHASIVSGDQQWLLRTRGQEPWQVVRFDLAANPSGAGPGQGVDLQAGAQQSPGRRLERQRALLLRLRAAQPARGAQAATLDRRDLLELAAMGYGGDEDGGDTGQDHERLPLDGGVWSDD
jgi:arylsulfatase A-like enzyme